LGNRDLPGELLLHLLSGKEAFGLPVGPVSVTGSKNF